MVSGKGTKKTRKPIETTLGKAPVKSKETEVDISHLRKPIETSISGLKQVLSVFETATNEVKDLLTYECDIIYECRICRTMFRSLANFILHKRNFCKDKFSPLDYINNNDTFKGNITPPIEPQTDSSPLGKVIQKLHEIEEVRASAKQFIEMDLSKPGNEPVRSMENCETKVSNFNNMILEKIDSNGSGIFQTLLSKSPTDNRDVSIKSESIKSQVMEIHKKIEDDVPVLDSQGKICGFTSSKLYETSLFLKSKFRCSECSHRFATQKSLANHIKYVHNPSKIIYICPTCKETFANPWCVYRHLLKVHRMTNKQVRRMREQVHNSWIRRDEEPSIQKKKPETSQSPDNSEHQWINDIEGDKDFQMCAGCGKHFERKAALHSHSQMCAKRLEICNNIRENAKKKGGDDVPERAKLDKVVSDKSISLKGASKRKRKAVCNYRKKENDLSEISESTFKLEKRQSAKNSDFDVKDNKDISQEYGISCPLETSKDNSSSKLSLVNCSSPKDKNTFSSATSHDLCSEVEFGTKEKSAVSSLLSTESKTSSSDCPELDSANISFKKHNDDTEIRDDSDTQNPSPSQVLTDPLLLSPVSSSCQIISRNNSVEEAIYISSSDESSQDKADISSNSNISTIPIKGLKFEEKDPLSLDSVNSNESMFLIPDNENHDRIKNILEDNSNLFSNEVTFEMFCEKVAEKTQGDDKKCSTNVPTLRNKKRKLTPIMEHVKNALDCSNPEDDVIFVDETMSTTDPFTEQKNGFPGFSKEETYQTPFAIDFSNLSYNNPLKSKSLEPPENIPSEKKCKTRDNCRKPETITKDRKTEFDFIPRAIPYMDRDKLMCIPCGLTFENFCLLLWHMSAHFSWFRFQCSKCSFISFNKHDCMSHAQNDHNLTENTVSRYILPLPNWKAVLMSHEFRLLKDCNALGGKHTDEKIGFEESNEHIESTNNILESDSRLFEECSNVEKSNTTITEKDSIKKKNKIGKCTIDIQETTRDFQKLPEPVELAMPADTTEIFKTLCFDEDALLSDETMESPDHCADESNDDWGLSNVCEFERPVNVDKSITVIRPDDAMKAEVAPLNIRPSRTRTKVMQDDFVYYDNDFNNVLKMTELFKNNSQKSRSDNVLTVKPKISSKSVPTIQKRKS